MIDAEFLIEIVTILDNKLKFVNKKNWWVNLPTNYPVQKAYLLSCPTILMGYYSEPDIAGTISNI